MQLQAISDARRLERKRDPFRVGSKWVRTLWMSVSLAAIALATLTPSSDSGVGAPATCLFICGARGLADTISNVLLFAPFGLALALSGLRARSALLLGISLAAGIEAAQLFVIPGRDASAADVISNAIGAFLGARLGLSPSTWLAPSAPRARRRLAVGSLVFLAAVTLPGILLVPRLPPGRYSAQSTPRAGPTPYTGRVVSAWIGERAISPDGAIPPDGSARLLQGAPLRLRLRTGPSTESSARIFRLRTLGGTAMSVHVQRDDLVLEYHSRAGYFWLDGPTIRLRNGLSGFTSVDTVLVEILRAANGFCVAVGAATACPAFTVASGWALFQSLDGSLPWLESALNFVWLAMLALPLGLWFRRDVTSLGIIGSVILGLSALPPLVGLSPLAPHHWTAATLGFITGGALSRWWRQRLAEGGSSDFSGSVASGRQL